MQLNLSFNPIEDKVSDFLEAAPQPFYSIPIPEKDQKSIFENLKKSLQDENIELIGYKAENTTAKNYNPK